MTENNNASARLDHAHNAINQIEPDKVHQTAFENLRFYQQQLDQDWVMVGVSREALDKVLGEYEALLSALKDLHLRTVAGTDIERHAALEVAWKAIYAAEHL